VKICLFGAAGKELVARLHDSAVGPHDFYITHGTAGALAGPLYRMLLTNGVTLSTALTVLLALPGAAAEGLEGVVEGVRRGGRLVDALARMNYLPQLALKMLRVGEESGELATVARRTAEFYETKLADRLDRLAGVIGPTAIVLIAVIVGGLIVSILSAILGVNQMVSQ